MLQLLVTPAAAAAATVCRGDLTTPLTDAHAVGSILLQNAQNRADHGQLWNDRALLNVSRLGEDGIVFSFVPWQVLYLLQGDRQLLQTADADASGEPGASLVICLCCVLILACLCAWSTRLMDDGKGMARPAGTTGQWSLRPTLQPASRRSRSPNLQARLHEETSSLSPQSFTEVCCPELVVPAGAQSVVGVPSLAALAFDTVPLDVVDPIGMPLLKVEVRSPLRPAEPEPHPSALESSAPLLVLRNLRPEPRGSLLNVPVEGWSDTSAMALAFLRSRAGILELRSPDLSIFGSLEREELSGKYVLRSGKAETVCMIFHGEPGHDPPQNTITVTDASNQVLARTQAEKLQFADPSGRFYSLQVFAGVDVGVLLCCLLFMEGRARKVF